MIPEKNYQDLKNEVWEKGTCSGCGACVAVCPADAICFHESASCPENTGYCKEATDSVRCGACISVCPRTEPATTETIGRYRKLVAARSVEDIPLRQSGGAITAILSHGLRTGLLDAVVTVTEDRWTLRPSSVVITDAEELVHSAGSRYSWWVPLLSALKTAVVDRKFRRIGIVGLPCVVQAVRRMRESENDLLKPYGRSIRLVVGLFCTESFDYQALVEGKLRKERGIETWQIRRLDVKGTLEVTLSDGTQQELPLSVISDAVRLGCHQCTDATALFADLSAGSVGSAEGYTTLIVRTPEGEAFLDSVMLAGRLDISIDVNPAAIERLAERKIKQARAIR
jgi:coenzyme F420 hydrogenase subunit beta